MFAKTILILNLLGGFKMKKKLVTVLLASSMVATMLADVDQEAETEQRKAHLQRAAMAQFTC